MAGLKDGIFSVKVTDYLYSLIENVKEEYGENSKEYKALYNQYIYSSKEDEVQVETNLKHYEAVLEDTEQNNLPNGIERLYKRQIVVNLTMVCAAHCRYCLRANYEVMQLTKQEINSIVNYCSEDANLKEILVTGGDPFMVSSLLQYFIEQIIANATNIKIIRIGTRVPVQDPDKIDSNLFSFFEKVSNKINIEVALQVNHVIELQSKTKNIIKDLQKSKVTIYSQNVLLKGVNDNIKTLITLYDTLRYLGIESHYLFHSIPMKGTNHLRTSVSKGLKLVQQLTASGEISGRTKPTYALMTYIGKVILYDGTIIKKDSEGYLHIKTYYRLKDRQKWNKYYALPKEQAYMGTDGYIVAKYLDGTDS